MRQWLDAGYFKGDLPIAQNPSGPFHTLTSLFPDSSIAFHPPPVNDMMMQENQAKKQAALVKEEKAREEAKKIARAEELERLEAEKRFSEERLKKENEAAELLELQTENIKSTEQNSSSAQLKMLLGLNDELKTDDMNGIVVATATTTDVNKTTQQSISEVTQSLPQPPSQSPPLSQSTTNLSGNHRATIKNASSGASDPKPVSVPTPAPVPAPAPIQPAWGGAAAAAKGTNKKSMSEIQREEARVAARLAKQNQNYGRSSSGGWANVAASGGGGTGWSSGAVKPSRSVSAGVSVPSQVRTKSTTVKVTNSSQSNSKVSTQQQSKASVIEDFGVSGKMSSSLESWCKEQMRKLNGSDDLTLVRVII